MLRNLRIWLAPILTLALLITYEAAHRHDDYAAAQEQRDVPVITEISLSQTESP